MIVYVERGMLSVGDTVVLELRHHDRLLQVVQSSTVKTVTESVYHKYDQMDEVEIG